MVHSHLEGKDFHLHKDSGHSQIVIVKVNNVLQLAFTI